MTDSESSAKKNDASSVVNAGSKAGAAVEGSDDDIFAQFDDVDCTESQEEEHPLIPYKRGIIIETRSSEDGIVRYRAWVGCEETHHLV